MIHLYDVYPPKGILFYILNQNIVQTTLLYILNIELGDKKVKTKTIISLIQNR